MTVRRLEQTPGRIDPVSLHRPIAILRENAIRYAQPDDEVEVSVSISNEMPALSVSDTGMGISSDERLRILERFYRGSGARAMSPDGSGLGLPIACRIAEAHHATLDLTARRGTVATMRFPAESLLPGPSRTAGDA